MKEDRFRSMFAAFGTVTDCSLKFTKDGKFRKFGFVGFKSEEDANRALQHFNKSFVDTSRVAVRALSLSACFWFSPPLTRGFLIQVEMCKAFGDPTKGKAWSKHTQQDKPAPPKTTDNTKVGAGHVSLVSEHTHQSNPSVCTHFHIVVKTCWTNVANCFVRLCLEIQKKKREDKPKSALGKVSKVAV